MAKTTNKPLTAADFPATFPVGTEPTVPAGLTRLWAEWGIPFEDWAQIDRLVGQHGGLAKAANAVSMQRDPATGWDTADLTASLKAVGAPIRDGLTSLLNSLRNEERGYVVMFGDHGQNMVAATSLQAHKVWISSQPVYLSKVPFDIRLAALVGMAVHESGHIREDRWVGQLRWHELLSVLGSSSNAAVTIGQAAVRRIINVLQDVRLEYRLGVTYPVYREVFPVTLWWVAQAFPPKAVTRLYADGDEAAAFVLTATRYLDYTTFGGGKAVEDERDWWVAWKYRHGGTPSANSSRTGDAFLQALKEACDHILDMGFVPKPAGEIEDPKPTGDDEDPEGPGGDDISGPGGSEGPGGDEGGDGGDDGGSEGPDGGDGGGKSDGTDGAEPCTCGCSVAAFAAAAVKPGCTDPGCKCHQGGTTGEGPGPGGDDEPPPEGGEGSDHKPDAHGGSRGKPLDTDDEQSPEEIEVETNEDALNKPLPVHVGDVDGDGNAGTRDPDAGLSDHWGNQSVSSRRTESNVIEVEIDGAPLRVVVSKTTMSQQPSPVPTDSDTVRALAQAFVSQRRSAARPQPSRGGRFSPQRAYRMRTGSTEVFTRRESLERDRLDVHLLVDNSGSMSYAIPTAIQVTANLAEAVLRTGKARVHVWAHNTQFHTQVYDLWDSRDGYVDQGYIGTMSDGGGNRDGAVIAALGEAVIAPESGEREQSVLVVISDGQPNETEDLVRSCVERVRSLGVSVISVAVEGGLSAIQAALYGHDAVVEWRGDWDRMAMDLMDVLAAHLAD